MRTIETLLEGLAEAAESDPLLSGRSHSDGWGAAVVNEEYVFEIHGLKPIYGDPAYKRLTEYMEDNTYVLIHARRASPGQPRGLLHTHPYHFHGEAGVDVWMAFNGSALNPSGGYRTDAYMIGEELADKCGGLSDVKLLRECIFREYEGIIDRVKSGGNLALLATDGFATELCLYPYYKTGRPRYRRYYTHYLWINEDISFIGSSSIIRVKHLTTDQLPEGKPFCI